METIYKKFFEYKNSPFGSCSLSGALHDGAPFSLVCITYDCLDRDNVISLLSQWRKQHEYWFQATFPVSDQRTKKWLQERLLDVPDRILFFIDVLGSYIGHVGLFRYDPTRQSIDIDNIVRGVEGYRGIMQSALTVLMDWATKECSIRIFTLQTTSDNTRALALYHRLGFTKVRRVPTIFQKTDEGGEWREVNDVHTAQRYNVYMKKDIL